MKVFLPATAVIFFIGRILGGPDGESKQMGREMEKQKERWVDQKEERRKKEVY